MNSNRDGREKTRAFIWLSIAGAVVATIAYVYMYWAAPLSPLWNDIVLDLAPVLAAGVAATMATHIWRQFDAPDRPRVTWRFFALALWTWTAAEVVWTVYALGRGEVPWLSWADAFWFAGYVLFAAAFLAQSRLVFRAAPGREWLTLAGVVLGVLILSLAITVALEGFRVADTAWLGTFLNIFYPLGDLALAFAALTLARVFGGGMWARPWIALTAFAVADTLYTCVAATGLYAVSSAERSSLSLLADTVYLDAYLVLALACYMQFLLIRRGPYHKT